ARHLFDGDEAPPFLAGFLGGGPDDPVRLLLHPEIQRLAEGRIFENPGASGAPMKALVRFLAKGLASGAYLSYLPVRAFKAWPRSGAGLVGTLWGLATVR